MQGFGNNKSTNSDKLNPNRDKDLFLRNQLALAKDYLLSGHILKAKKIYSDLINQGKKSYDLLFSYALLSRNCSEFKLAKELLIQSISRYPTQVDHYILLKLLYHQETILPLVKLLIYLVVLKDQLNLVSQLQI